MTSKKTRIAKGLGASALAVATLASGLSFGSAASANTDPTRLGDVQIAEQSAPLAANGQRAVLDPEAPSYTDNMQPFYGKNRDMKFGKDFEYFGAKIKDSPSRNLVYDFALTPAIAISKSDRLSVPAPGLAQMIKIEGSGACLAMGANVNAVWADSRCDINDPYLRWYLSEDGALLNWMKPQPMGQTPLVGQGARAQRFDVGGENPISNEEWAGSLTLSGVVEFAASVDDRAVVKGSTEANGRVEVRRGSTVVGTATANANGDYSVPIAAPDKAGDDKLTVALVVDGADKKTVDVTAAYGAGVAITAPTNGDVVSGQYTITGTAQVGSNVSVQVNGGTARPVTVSGNGQWSQDVTLPMGERTITATQKSKGANTTTDSVTVNPGEDGNQLPAPTAQIVFPENVEQRAVANGTGAAGASIEIFDGTTRVGSATVGANGSWTSQLVAVGSGVRTLTIKQALGDKSNEGTVDADYGTELTVNTPAAVRDTSQVTLTGTGTAGAKIEFRDNTGTVRMTRVLDDGTWSLAGNFRPDTTTVTVSSVSKGALQVRKSTTVDVTITTREITVTSPTQDDANNDRIKDGTVQFTGTATPFATVQFATWPDGLGREVFTTYADENGNWSASGWLAKSYYKLSGVQYAVGGDVTRYNMFPFSTVGFQALNVEGPTEGDVVIGGVNTFTGTATPGATIEIKRKDTGQVIARGTAEGEKGIFNARTELRTGMSYQLEAVQTALNGKTDTVDLGTITPVASQSIADLAFTHNGDMNDGNNITFTFRAQPGAEVSVWTGAKEEAGDAKPWIRQMASGTADKYGHVKISGYAAVNNPYNLKVYAGTEVVNFDITTTPTK